jgi:hypothetical protein
MKNKKPSSKTRKINLTLKKKHFFDEMLYQRKNSLNVDGTSAKHQDYCDFATKYTTTKSIVGTLIMTN